MKSEDTEPHGRRTRTHDDENALTGARTLTSITELRNALLEEYDVDETRCGDDLLALLETMRTEGLIEVRGVAGGA